MGTVPTVDLRRHVRATVDLLKIAVKGADFDVMPHRASALFRVRTI